MNRAVTVARVLLALPFVVFGINYFFPFMPDPDHPPEAGAFLVALTDARYLWPVAKTVEVGAGLLILTGQYVPLALVLLAPILVNIVGYHLVLEPTGQGLGMALALAAMHVFLVLSHLRSYRGMLLRVPETH